MRRMRPPHFPFPRVMSSAKTRARSLAQPMRRSERGFGGVGEGEVQRELWRWGRVGRVVAGAGGREALGRALAEQRVDEVRLAGGEPREHALGVQQIRERHPG
jgi:hypothetical protein